MLSPYAPTISMQVPELQYLFTSFYFHNKPRPMHDENLKFPNNNIQIQHKNMSHQNVLKISSTLHATYTFRPKARQYFHMHITTTPALTASIPLTLEQKSALLTMLPSTSTRSIVPPSSPTLRSFLKLAPSIFCGEIHPLLSTQNIS